MFHVSVKKKMQKDELLLKVLSLPLNNLHKLSARVLFGIFFFFFFFEMSVSVKFF